MTIATDELLKLLCGVTPADEFAARHGMSLEQVEATRADGLAKISRVLAPQPRRRRMMGVIVGLALVALVPATALAQLVTFTADTPARADQVNNNFAQLKTWLEAKVGLVTAPGLQTPSVTTSLLTASSLSVASDAGFNGTTTFTGTANFPSTSNFTGSTAITGSLNLGTGAPSLTSTVNGVRVLRVNGVELRAKTTNNGTVNCDSFCNGSYEGWSGACLGSKIGAGTYSSDCGTTFGGTTHCLCATY